MKHSGFGIASFAVFVVAVLVLCSALLAAIVVIARGPATESTNILAGGLLVTGGLLLLFSTLIGVGLGLAGLFQPDRKKAFSIVGVVVNIATLLGIIFLSAFSTIFVIVTQIIR